MSSPIEVDHTVVVWAPRGRDGVLAAKLIERHGLRAIVCTSVDELMPRITDAGCAVITSEVLSVPVRELLGAALAAQPPWSDFPIILLGPRGVDREDEAMTAIELLGNVTILERPLHSGTLIGAVVAALRGRRRQYEAREAIARRDQFLAMLGHELRNPLAAIMLAMETLPPTNGSQPGDKQRSIVERQTRHLARLVDDLLDVARVTSGKVQLQTEPLELSEVVERCLQGAELAARTRNIELRTELSPSALVIDGDLVRLEEIFNNLIGNAIKYSPEGARVTLRTRREGPRCIVEIADTGIGIAPEMIGRVFDLFAQADATLDRSQGGLGIGLTLVRSLVELHSGTISARSSGLGRGSTFIVELPLSRSAGPTQPQLTVVTETQAVKVVVIEDNPDVLDMTKELLEGAGCEVSTAPDGALGLSLLVATQPDIAFIDIGLPVLDGYAIAKTARAQGLTSFLVAMTGYGQPEDRERALAAGFDRHITKPVTAASLRASMREAEQARLAGASRPHRARS